jgi:hypothetical protein
MEASHPSERCANPGNGLADPLDDVLSVGTVGGHRVVGVGVTTKVDGDDPMTV